jgi:hypothetical protein
VFNQLLLLLETALAQHFTLLIPTVGIFTIQAKITVRFPALQAQRRYKNAKD